MEKIGIIANVAPVATIVAAPFNIASAAETTNIEQVSPAVNTVKVQSGKKDEKEVEVKEILSTSQSWDGAQLPSYPTANPFVRVLHIVIPAHAVLPEHHHDVMSYGYVVRGELTIIRTSDGKEITLHAGEAVAETVGTQHKGENRGDEPTELVVFYPSVKGQELSCI